MRRLRSNIGLYFGSEGLRWLADLETHLGRVAEGYDLQIGPPFPDLSINYVAPAIRLDGTEVVLKLGVPNPEVRTEIEALRAFDGHGAVRLLESASASGLLILERLRPGSPVRDLSDDDKATRIAAEVMAELRRHEIAPDPMFPRLEDWFEAFVRHRFRFDGGSGQLPGPLFDRAESLARELLDSTEHSVLLHGDLHHGNILSATREPWLAIDPKGILGDPCFEIAPFIRNPMPGLSAVDHLGQILERRLAIFQEHLGYDIERMRAWVIAESILSALWDIDDSNEGWRHGVKVAETLRTRNR